MSGLVCSGPSSLFSCTSRVRVHLPVYGGTFFSAYLTDSSRLPFSTRAPVAADALTQTSSSAEPAVFFSLLSLSLTLLKCRPVGSARPHLVRSSAMLHMPIAYLPVPSSTYGISSVVLCAKSSPLRPRGRVILLCGAKASVSRIARAVLFLRDRCRPP